MPLGHYRTRGGCRAAEPSQAQQSGAEQDGPDGLAPADDRAPAPDVAERVDQLQAAAALGVLARGLEDGGGVTGVEHRAHDLARPAEQPQADPGVGASRAALA